MNKKKRRRRVVVALFAERHEVYLAKVRVEAPLKSRNRDILELFHGEHLPPFLDWQVWSEPMSLSSARNPAIVGRFDGEEPDIVMKKGRHGLEIVE